MAATIVLGFSAQASAFSLGPASDFNVFVLGDIEQNDVDTEGRMAAGGNVTLSDYGVGVELTNSNGTRNDLIVGGNLITRLKGIFLGHNLLPQLLPLLLRFRNPPLWQVWV